MLSFPLTGFSITQKCIFENVGGVVISHEMVSKHFLLVTFEPRHEISNNVLVHHMLPIFGNHLTALYCG